MAPTDFCIKSWASFTFICEDGYKLSGASSSKCGQDGLLPKKPTCEGITLYHYKTFINFIMDTDHIQII